MLECQSYFCRLHAAGHAECSGNCRQNTNRGLNHELPYFLVLHNDLVF